jgi:hypothetical protein
MSQTLIFQVLQRHLKSSIENNMILLSTSASSILQFTNLYDTSRTREVHASAVLQPINYPLPGIVEFSKQWIQAHPET